MSLLLSQITELSSLPECQLLKGTRYWLTDVRLISARMLETLLTELEQQHGQIAADNCINTLLKQATYDFLIGRINNVQLLNYEVPIRSTDRNLATNILDSLTGMEHSAVLFSLIEKIRLADAAILKWGDVDFKKLQPASVSLLKTIPVHLNSPIIFWTQKPGCQLPRTLIDFLGYFTDITEMTWERFAQCIYTADIDYTKNLTA